MSATDRQQWVARKMAVNSSVYLVMLFVMQAGFLIDGYRLRVAITNIAFYIMLLAGLMALIYPLYAITIEEAQNA